MMSGRADRARQRNAKIRRGDAEVPWTALLGFIALVAAPPGPHNVALQIPPQVPISQYLMARNQPPKLPSSPKPARIRRVVIPEAGIDVELKDPWLAAFLAWLLPGLGHLYQRRTAKGVLFMVCVLGTFLFGLYLGEGHVVYASLPHQQPYRWQYWCQIGAGAPALPALVQRERIKRGSEPLADGLMAPPRDPDIVRRYGLRNQVSLESKDEAGNLVHHPTELAKWNHDLPSNFELGTVFTMVAGLLNVLVIYDVFAGPLVILPDPRKKKKRKKKEEDQESDDEGPNGEARMTKE